MTPAQQSALEGLLFRPLTLAEIGDIDPLLDPNNRNDVAITAIVNAGLPDVVGSITVEQVFSALRDSGDYVTLKTAQSSGNPLAVMAFGMLSDSKTLGDGKVHPGQPVMSGMLDQLVAGNLLSTAGRGSLVAMATIKSKTYHFNDISYALNAAEGRVVL